MVTKRKPPKQNSEQGAPAKPARPSVKGKTVARGQVRPEADAKGQVAKPAGSVGASARSGAGAGTGSAAAGSAVPQPASQAKPKRRIAMPQSSTRLKQNAASKAEAAKPDAAKADATKASAEKPTPRKPKRFSVAKAEKHASDQAKEFDGKVLADAAASAEDAARTALAADAAKRRLERRQRMLQHQAQAETSAEEGASSKSGKPSRRRGLSLPNVGAGENPPAATVEGNAADATDAEAAKPPRARKARSFHVTWPLGIGLAVLAIVVVAVSVFSWGRWLRYDDAADFQGMWYANGTTSIVTVDGEKIHLTDDVAYNYTLDTGAKTITFTFGQMEGHGRYRFSVDRSELVITDGSNFSFWGNLFDDIGWQLDQAIRNMQGQEIEREAVVDGVTVLDRTQTQGAAAATGTQGAGAASASDGSADAETDDANVADDTAADAVDGAASESSADVSAGESSDSAASGNQTASDSSDSSFQGAVAEGGIDSAGSNAVTLEQLKSGSL